MAGLGNFAMEEMEKSKKKKLPEKAKAMRAAKSMRLWERSEHNQQSKEGETPKRKGSRRNCAKSDKQPSADSDSLDQEYFNFSMLLPNSPNVQAKCTGWTNTNASSNLRRPRCTMTQSPPFPWLPIHKLLYPHLNNPSYNCNHS